MLKNLSADNIYIVCGHTDMRKSIDGLAAIVQHSYRNTARSCHALEYDVACILQADV